ncbi:class I adenylate-forming enzyme family protein [Xinfangfangia pollutisoli]|uniref:class I adenylate-forming enzyme family protein n=1 Tax=Xinfangfangia pollutisoli TaxID=2865960 RepID=UPI001CD591FE|nr:class I adenylate-forming enzyme family protein [Xinfangfangia pollutisoli]
MSAKASPGGYYAALREVLLNDPDRVVVWRRDQPITAGAFLQGAANMAGWLAGCGHAAGDRLGLALHDNLHTIQMTLACWMLDAEPMILDHRLTREDLPAWQQRYKLRGVISGQARLADLPGIRLFPGPAQLPQTPLPPLPVGSPADRRADFITSSGVSGPPKVGAHTQASMLAAVRDMIEDERRGVWGAALSVISVAFGGARYFWWRNLLAGVPVHVMDLLFSIEALDAALLDPRIEDCTLPPNLIRALADHAEKMGATTQRYPHIRKLQSIGGPARAEDKLRAYHLLTTGYVMTYSSTETGLLTRIEGADLLAHPDSCGRILPGLEVQIVDAEDRPCGVGTVGRIRLHRAGKPGEEASYAYPGDLGWFDAAGFLYIAARGEGIICRNGENFSAAVLEARLLDLPWLRDVAVIRVPGRDDNDDAILLALDAGETPVAQIRRQLRQRLIAREYPTGIWMLKPEDYTAGGKIQRQRIAATWSTAPERFLPF